MKLSPLAFGLSALALAGCQKKESARPNIVYIMSDDHAYQAISAFGHGLNHTPNIDRLATEGVRFTNSFCTNSICAPCRAVVLTGKFSHMNGHKDNANTFNGAQTTFPKLLREAGYQTAMIGKWHLVSDPTGFDFWKILIGQGPYYNPDMKDSTGIHKYTGYTTTLITDEALNWLDHRNQERPFLLMIHHKAPHRNWMPEPKYFTAFQDSTYSIPDNYFDDYSNRGRAAMEQKMSVIKDMMIGYDLKAIHPDPNSDVQGDNWIKGQLEQLNSEQLAAWNEHYEALARDFYARNLEGEELALWKFQRYMRDYLACIQSVDDNVGRVLDYLEQHGLDKNTLVVYTSDQGFYLGEHGWFDKRFMYEESLRMPLLMRFPEMIKAGTTTDAMVQNVDFAQTFLDLAGVTMPDSMQGLSLVPVFNASSTSAAAPPGWRNSIYYHYYEYPGAHSVKRHYGVRTDRYKLIHFYHDIDEWELYDLEKDPHEMMNIYQDPGYTQVREDLHKELDRLREEYQDKE